MTPEPPAHLYTLRREHAFPQPLERVFRFFERPENLARITPPSMGFVIRTPSPIVMREGLQIDYTVRVAGIRLRWTSDITVYRPPHEFVDEQVRGPYRYWHHRHVFAAVPEGTRVTDEVRYALGFGPLGRLVHALYVRRELERIFDYRQRVMTDLVKEF